MNYTRESFYNLVLDALQQNTLLTPKHNPYSGTTINSNFHTVVAYELVNNFQSLLGTPHYDIIQYDNTNPNHGSLYFEITPHAGAGFTVTGSGVTSNTITSDLMDRLVIVSGHAQGVHIFAAKRGDIAAMVSGGTLVNPRTLDS